MSDDLVVRCLICNRKLSFLSICVGCRVCSIMCERELAARTLRRERRSRLVAANISAKERDHE